MEEKINRNLINHRYNLNMKSKKEKTLQLIGMLTNIFLYLFCMVVIILMSNYTKSTVNINGHNFSIGVFKGILAQVQVLLAICIVMHPVKGSFRAALVLNIISILGASRAAIFRGDTDAVAGVVIPVSAIVMVSIIRKYTDNIKQQVLQVTKQKEELSTLYAKDIINSKKLQQQNEVLKEFNLMMKENEEKLQSIAYFDNLTQLPNRRMVLDRMESLTKEQDKESFIFVFLGLDGFKKINDSMGHDIGDSILQKIAGRFKEKVNQDDLLGRLGGDEFAIIINRKLSQEELLEYIQGFREALREAITLDRKDFYISASFGITSYPKDGYDATELLKNADIALYRAKKKGRSEIQFFNREMREEIVKRIQLENGLLSAIKNGELYVVFQPMYECDGKTLRGFEALARWKYPEFGHVSPNQFIPIAEETGIIIQMGKWIMKTVLNKFMELQKEYDIRLVVSINISVVQMLEPSFVQMIEEVLAETGFDGSNLELEITESVFISYPDHIIMVINQLREMGIRIALDDFGTGYASLSYLQMLPINILKIDKTFIDKIKEQDDRNHIIGNIISLAHQLGYKVVAEGVEHESQLNYLIEQQCDYIQGYLLGRPLEEEQLKELLSAQMNYSSRYEAALTY